MSKRTGLLLSVLIVAALAVYGLYVYPRQKAESVLDAYLASIPGISASDHGPVYYDVANGNLQIDDLRITLNAPPGVSLDIGHLEMRGFSTSDQGTMAIGELILADAKLMTSQSAHSFDRIIVSSARLPAELLKSEKFDTLAGFAAAFLPEFEANRVEIRQASSTSSRAGASTSLTVDSAILNIVRDQTTVRTVLLNTAFAGKTGPSAPEKILTIEKIDAKDFNHGTLIAALDSSGDREIGAEPRELAGDIQIRGITQLSPIGTTTRYDRLSIDSLELGRLPSSFTGFFTARGADITAWAGLLRSVRFDAALLSGVQSVAADETALLSLSKFLIEGYRFGTLNSIKLEGFQGREPNAKAFFSSAILLVRDLDAGPALADISAARQPDFNQLWARDITLKSFAFEDDVKGEIAAISKLRIRRGENAGGWPRTGKIELDRLRIQTQAASGPIDNTVLKALGYGRLVLSLNLTQDWSPENGTLRLSDGALILSSGGRLKFDINFRNVDPGFFAGGLLAADFTGLPVAGAAFSYEDDGLAERIIKRSAVGTTRTFDAARTEILGILRINLEASPFAEIAEDLTAAATALANGGGKAALTARPASTVTLGDILRRMITGSTPGVLEDLNLDVTYTIP